MARDCRSKKKLVESNIAISKIVINIQSSWIVDSGLLNRMTSEMEKLQIRQNTREAERWLQQTIQSYE